MKKHTKIFQINKIQYVNNHSQIFKKMLSPTEIKGSSQDQANLKSKKIKINLYAKNDFFLNTKNLKTFVNFQLIMVFKNYIYIFVILLL